MTVKPFVNDDWDAELIANDAMAKKSKAEIEKEKKKYESEVRRRLGIFRRGIWGSFFALITAVVAAEVASAFIPQTSSSARVFLGGSSIFVFAWATLARLSRSATSLGGATVLERIDERMLWILYWFGTLLGTLALI
jgi:predicted permease